MPNRNKDNSGCFSGLFRRLLCAGSPPQTHPSDRFPDPVEFDDEVKFSATKIQIQSPNATTGPGVVARLMGLESLPRTSVQKNPGPVSRSRSVNFMDYLLEFDSTETNHRRVRTTVSFREQNQDRWADFPAVIFEEKDNSSSRRRKSEKRRGLGTKPSQKEMNVENRVLRREENQNQRKKNKKISKLKNEPRRVPGKCPSNVRIKRRMNSKAKIPFKSEEDRKQRKKKRDQIGVSKVEFEHDSSISSPISIFDSENFHFRPENSSSEFSGSMEMELRTNEKSKKEMNEAEIYLGLTEMLRNLSGEDIKQESNWIKGKVLRFEDFEDLCFEFGEDILNYMLSQVVDELVGLKP